MPQHGGEETHIGVLERGEPSVDPARISSRDIPATQEAGGHHRGESEGHDAGDQDRPGKSEGKLTEEGSGQPTLDADRGVDRGQRDCHRNDRAEEFASAPQGGMQRGEALMDMPLHILDDHDGVIDHKSHREHDGKQGEEIHAEAEQDHDEGGSD